MRCIVLIMVFNRNLVMTPTRPNTLSSSVKVYKKNIITNKYQHDAYYCTYDTNSSQPMREWFKLGFVYSIHINTNMVKIVWVGLEQASPQYITIAIIFCAMGVVTIALYPPALSYLGSKSMVEIYYIMSSYFKRKIENRFGIFVVEKRQVEGFS